MMKIRKAQVLDVPALTEMWAKMMEELKIPGCSYDDYAKTLFFFNQTIRMGDQKLCETNYAFLAEADGKPLGFISGCSDGINGELYCVCEQLFVEKVYRNRRIAQTLIGAAVEWGKKKGAKKIQMLSAPQRVNFYKNFGFKLVNVRMVADINNPVITEKAGG